MSYQKIKNRCFWHREYTYEEIFGYSDSCYQWSGNDLLGWVIIISFELTGSEGKFQDDVFHWIILLAV